MRAYNKFALAYTLVVLGYVVLSISFYLSGFRPLAEQLRIQHGNEIAYAMDATQRLIDGVLERQIALAIQTSSRSAIRDAQARYLSDEISLEAYRAFSEDKLADGLRASEEMLGVRRHTPDGKVLLEVGSLPADFVWIPCQHPRAREARILGTTGIDSASVLVYCSSIDSPGFGWLGFDLLFMDAQPLKQVLEQPQYHDLRTIAFSVADTNGRILFWPGDPTDSRRRGILERHLKSGQPPPAGHAIESRPLVASGLVLHAVVDEAAFFAQIDRQLLGMVGVLVFWGVLIVLFTLLGLQRLLRSAAAVQSLSHRVQRDGMTGLMNHETMQELLDVELARNRDDPVGLSLLMFDLDHFKAVNDQHGHPAGDRVLQRIAQAMRQLARVSDHVARYGGEEFLVIMPGSTPEGAKQFADRLRVSLGQILHRSNGEEFHVTISVGVVSCPAGVTAPAKEVLLGMADAALYESKREGRDRVTQTILTTGRY